MQGYAKIENPGEVDLNAFKLIGASSKEGDESKIGFFGSGIKYAIAAALREEIPIRIFSGVKEVKITTQKAEMRGQEFDVVCINGEPTSITTRMGKDWLPWFIVRELYCNALDEGGNLAGVTDKPKGEKDKTTVYIGMVPKMKEVFSNMDQYFAFNRTARHEANGIKIYDRIGEKMTAYRKGIRVYFEHDSIFDYDFERIGINESRVSSDWDVTWNAVCFWKEYATAYMVNQLITEKSKWEYQFTWSHGFSKMSEGWATALAHKKIIPEEYSGHFVDELADTHVMLPFELCKALHKAFGSRLNIKGMTNMEDEIMELPITDKQAALLKTAINFLKCSPLFVDIDRYPIKIAELSKGTLGAAHDNTIFMSVQVFTKGAKEVTATLLEEYVHLKTKTGDRTREMQDILIGYIIDSIEEKTKVLL